MTRVEPRTAGTTEEEPEALPEQLAVLAAIRDGQLPPPPLATLLGMRPVDLRRGEVSFALDPGYEHYNPIGSVHGGVIATLLDTAMGCAVHSILPPEVSFTTTNLALSYFRTITVESGTILAIGTVLHSGRRTATTEGRLVAAADGALLATATATQLLLA
jgi:uncharacterized protein (TIGR00369 family)